MTVAVLTYIRLLIGIYSRSPDEIRTLAPLTSIRSDHADRVPLRLYQGRIGLPRYIIKQRLPDGFLLSGRIKDRLTCQNAPDNPRQFMRNGDNALVQSATLDDVYHPARQICVFVSLGPAQCVTCSLHQ